MRVQTLKVQEVGPGLGSISPDSNRRKNKNILSRRMKRERDGVKKNDKGIVFKFLAYWAAAVVGYDEQKGDWAELEFMELKIDE